MTEPLTLPITAFLGDEQSQNPLLLSAAYSSGGSVNLYIDKLGRIRTWDGWVRQKAAALTTDTGGSAAIGRALFMFKKTAAGVVTRQLLAVLDDQTNEYEVWRSSDLGATWTFVADLGAGSINTIPCFALFGDELYITNGVVAPRLWDGTNLTTAGATQLAAPVLNNAGPGQLNGSYRYRVVPVKANKVRKPGSVLSAALQVQNGRIGVTWVADADVTVVGYELYRTSGTGQLLYFVSYIDGRTTVTYPDDTLPDPNLISRTALAVVGSNGDAPLTGTYFVVVHRGRAWWARTDTFPRRVWPSDPGDADSIYPDFAYFDLTDAESLGDVLVGGVGEFENLIVWFCRESIWVISGTGVVVGADIDWRRRRTNAKTGTPTARAVVKVARGAVYMDQDGRIQRTERNHLVLLSSFNDIRLFDGNNDTIISFPKTDTLARINPEHAHKSWAMDDDVRGMVNFCVPLDAATEPNYTISWNYRYGTWHEADGTTFGHATKAESSTGAKTFIAVEDRIATGALFYGLWTGNNRDGAVIAPVFMSKPLYPPVVEGGLPDLQQEKRFQDLFLMFTKDGTPTDITVDILPHDAGDADAASIARTLTGTSRTKVPMRQKATDANPGQYFYGVGCRLRVKSSGTQGPWVLERMDVVYQPLKGRTR